MKKAIITEGQYIGTGILLKESFGSDEIGQLKELIESGNSDNFELAIAILEGRLSEDQISEFIENEYGKLIDILNLQDFTHKKYGKYQKNIDGLRSIFGIKIVVLLNGIYKPEYEKELSKIVNIVRYLGLSGCGLTKIPEFVFECYNLTDLAIKNNFLEDIPNEIKLLRNLKYLWIMNRFFEKKKVERQTNEWFNDFSRRLKQLLPKTTIDIIDL